MATNITSKLDIARNLLQASFRAVEFESGAWTFGFDQAHAAHLYPDRDAGFIEGSGRNPATYTFTAYFRNGIGGMKDILFPTRWQKFVGAMADRTTGTLQQPALGKLKVKPVRCETTFDPEKRDGVDVQCSFIETSDAEDELSALLKGASPMAVAIAAAGDVDAACAIITPKPEYPESLSPSLLDTMKGISGSLDMFKRGIGNIGAGIDNTLGGINSLAHSVESLSANDPNIVHAIRSINRAFDALVNVASTATTSGKKITRATVKGDATMDAVAGFFAMSVDELGRLNPRLGLKSRVFKGTIIVVFA